MKKNEWKIEKERENRKNALKISSGPNNTRPLCWNIKFNQNSKIQTPDVAKIVSSEERQPNIQESMHRKISPNENH